MALPRQEQEVDVLIDVDGTLLGEFDISSIDTRNKTPEQIRKEKRELIKNHINVDLIKSLDAVGIRTINLLTAMSTHEVEERQLLVEILTEDFKLNVERVITPLDLAIPVMRDEKTLANIVSKSKQDIKKQDINWRLYTRKNLVTIQATKIFDDLDNASTNYKTGSGFEDAKKMIEEIMSKNITAQEKEAQLYNLKSISFSIISILNPKAAMQDLTRFPEQQEATAVHAKTLLVEKFMAERKAEGKPVKHLIHIDDAEDALAAIKKNIPNSDLTQIVVQRNDLKVATAYGADPLIVAAEESRYHDAALEARVRYEDTLLTVPALQQHKSEIISRRTKDTELQDLRARQSQAIIISVIDNLQSAYKSSHLIGKNTSILNNLVKDLQNIKANAPMPTTSRIIQTLVNFVEQFYKEHKKEFAGIAFSLNAVVNEINKNTGKHTLIRTVLSEIKRLNSAAFTVAIKQPPEKQSIKSFAKSTMTSIFGSKEEKRRSKEEKRTSKEKEVELPKIQGK